MSDRHTNPSGLRPSVRTEDLEVSNPPDAQEPRPISPGPQRPAPSGAFRSKPRDPGLLPLSAPGGLGEQQITLPDTEAARHNANGDPSAGVGTFGTSGNVELGTSGGTERGADGAAGVGTLGGGPAGEEAADSPNSISVEREGAAATAAIALPDTDAAREAAVSKAAPDTPAAGEVPVFASRRERKLYETGAIGFPTGSPSTAPNPTVVSKAAASKAAASKSAASESAALDMDPPSATGVSLGTAATNPATTPSPETVETSRRRKRLGFRKPASPASSTPAETSSTATAADEPATPNGSADLSSEATSTTDVLETSTRRLGLRKSSAELDQSTGDTATAPSGLPATASPPETSPATDVLETPTRRRRQDLRESTELTQSTKTDATEASEPASKRPSFFALLTRVIAALIAVAGVALLAVGGLKATAWAPSDVVVGRLGAHSANFVTAEVGVLSLSGPRLQVRVSGTGSDPVFVGIGRAADVDAYLGDAKADRIVGLNKDKGQLITRSQGSDPAAVLDPASADVWSVSALGQGSATLTWPEPASGQWRLLISTDGARAAPQNVTLTWSGTQPTNPAPAWIAVGVVLLVAGVIVSMMLRARSRDRRRA